MKTNSNNLVRLPIIGILFCGGQVSPSNLLLQLIFEQLQTCFPDSPVIGIRRGFFGMANPDNYVPLTQELIDGLSPYGTWLQTCRNYFPEEHLDEILPALKRAGINTLIILGGDGTLRGAAEAFSDAMAEHLPDMKLYFIPCTIDGINGSDATVGIDCAAAFSAERSLHLIANAWGTYDADKNGASRTVIVQHMGRDRDDLLVRSAEKIVAEGRIGDFFMRDVTLKLIPTNWDWSLRTLAEELLRTPPSVHIALLCSEGAKPNDANLSLLKGESVAEKLKNYLEIFGCRKVNAEVIGYGSQSNGVLNDDVRHSTLLWAKALADAIAQGAGADGFLRRAIVCRDGAFLTVPLDELAAQNDAGHDTPDRQEHRRRQTALLEPLRDYLPPSGKTEG